MIGRLLRGGFMTAIYAYLYIPIIILIVNSFNSSRFGINWQGFTTKWYSLLLNNDSLLQAAQHSLTMAVFSATFATLIGSLTAVALYRYRFRGKPFVSGMLFVVMMMAAPGVTDGNFVEIQWSAETFLPSFDAGFLMSLSILVFAVGGCEKISPYVNKMKDPARDFSRGMIALAVMVAVTAVLGTISLGLMFDSEHIPGDLMTNGAYYAFERLGEYYHVGNFFVIAYALTNLVGQFSVMVLSIDAPLRMLLESADRTYIPAGLLKKNEKGVYVNGQKLIGLIAAVLIVVPAFGIRNVDALVRWLVKVNSVCMPLRYLWVFVAYIALKMGGEKFPALYRFVRRKETGIAFGVWCFVFTAFACLTGIYSEDPFQLILNIVTPFVLVGLGFIMPMIANKERRQTNEKL